VTVCVFKGAKRNKNLRRIFALFWLLSFCSSFFFFISDDRCVFLSVVVKNTLSLHSKSKTKACGGHSLIVVMRSLLKGGEEYSSTGDDYYKYELIMSRAAALISTNNTMSQF
jgi:hypothetical protein